jgi:cytochrome c-type biogenesis protein
LGLEQSAAGAALAGLLSFLSPCILPLVPAYLAFLTGSELSALTGETSPQPGLTRRAVIRSLAFALGFATVFVLLGAGASYAGRLLSVWFDWLAVVAGAIITIMGLHFLGLFRIALLFREARFQTSGRPASLFGAYVVGLAFAFGWTPCVGPVLASILMIAGAQESAARGTLLLGAYALGIGIPFVLAAAFAGPFMRFLARFRRHIGMIEKILGAAMVLTGVLIMTGKMSLVGNWLLETFPIFGKIG